MSSVIPSPSVSINTPKVTLSLKSTSAVAGSWSLGNIATSWLLFDGPFGSVDPPEFKSNASSKPSLSESFPEATISATLSASVS